MVDFAMPAMCSTLLIFIATLPSAIGLQLPTRYSFCCKAHVNSLPVFTTILDGGGRAMVLYLPSEIAKRNNSGKLKVGQQKPTKHWQATPSCSVL